MGQATTFDNWCGHRWLIAIAVVLLILIHYAIAVSSVWHKCNTVDEIAHLTAGYAQWRLGDHRLDPENAALQSRVAALPLLAMDLRFPSLDSDAWRGGHVWKMGWDFFYELGNPIDAMLWRARAVNALWSVAIGVVVFIWSRRLFGKVGGLLSLTAWAFSPALLANGPLVTSDVPAALGFLLATATAWIALHRLTLPTLGAMAAALSVLALTKFSAPLMVFVVALMLTARLFRGLPMHVGCWRPSLRVAHRAGVIGITMAAIVAAGVVVVALIWAVYGFRFSAFADGHADPARFYRPWSQHVPRLGAKGPILDALMRYRLLPQAYIYGLGDTLAMASGRRAYALGHYGDAGWWWFFPVIFALKTPLGLFGLLGVAAARWRRSRWRAALYRTAPLWALLLVYGATALTSRLNIGHRHLLPIYPVLFIFIGAAGPWLVRRGTMRVVTLLLTALLVIEGLAIYPHYLTYFNPICGPSRAYRWFVDSSLDWGQDLPGLRRWLDAQGLNASQTTPVYLSYFGTASPTHYGIQTLRLPSYNPRDRIWRDLSPLQPGVYCISATMLQVLMIDTWGRWNPQYEKVYQVSRAFVTQLTATADDPQARAKLLGNATPQDVQGVVDAYMMGRFTRLCLALRQREPDDAVGHSILIYRVSADELDRALNAPPAELRPTNEITGLPQ